MKQVIRIPDDNDKQEKVLKPIEFTHEINDPHGWVDTSILPTQHYKVVYLGKCRTDGDMFAGYAHGDITIFKGHLNDGVY